MNYMIPCSINIKHRQSTQLQVLLSIPDNIIKLQPHLISSQVHILFKRLQGTTIFLCLVKTQRNYSRNRWTLNLTIKAAVIVSLCEAVKLIEIKSLIAHIKSAKGDCYHTPEECKSVSRVVIKLFNCFSAVLGGMLNLEIVLVI